MIECPQIIAVQSFVSSPTPKTRVDPIILVDEFGKPAQPSSGTQTFPAYARIDLGIETRRSKEDSCPVEWEKTQRRNRDLAEAALFDASQYKDDRDLLYWARENKIKIVFDLCETSSHEADAICDFKNNAVVVKPGRSVAAVQYGILHELQHMFDRSNGLVAVTGMSLKSGTIVSRALEANARTREALHAYGCEYGLEDGFYKPVGLLKSFERDDTIPVVIEAAREASHHLKSGDKDAFCRKVFASFYRQESALAFYDNGKINFLEEFTPRLTTSPKTGRSVLDRVMDIITLVDRRAARRFDESMSTFMADDSWNHEKISQKIPFLAGASFSLDDPDYYGLTDKVRDRYLKFSNALEMLGAATGHKPKCDMPVFLFQPKEDVSAAPDKKPVDRLLEVVAVAIPVQAPPKAQIMPEWQPIDIGHLIAASSAPLQQAQPG